MVAHLANEERLLTELSARERGQLNDLLRKLLVSEPFAELDPTRSLDRVCRMTDPPAGVRRPRPAEWVALTRRAVESLLCAAARRFANRPRPSRRYARGGFPVSPMCIGQSKPTMGWVVDGSVLTGAHLDTWWTERSPIRYRSRYRLDKSHGDHPIAGDIAFLNRPPAALTQSEVRRCSSGRGTNRSIRASRHDAVLRGSAGHVRREYALMFWRG